MLLGSFRNDKWNAGFPEEIGQCASEVVQDGAIPLELKKVIVPLLVFVLVLLKICR